MSTESPIYDEIEFELVDTQTENQDLEEEFEIEDDEEKIPSVKNSISLIHSSKYKHDLYSVFIRILKFYASPKDIITNIDKLRQSSDIDIYHHFQIMLTPSRISKVFDDSCRHKNRVQDVTKIFQEESYDYHCRCHICTYRSNPTGKQHPKFKAPNI